MSFTELELFSRVIAGQDCCRFIPGLHASFGRSCVIQRRFHVRGGRRGFSESSDFASFCTLKQPLSHEMLSGIRQQTHKHFTNFHKQKKQEEFPWTTFSCIVFQAHQDQGPDKDSETVGMASRKVRDYYYESLFKSNNFFQLLGNSMENRVSSRLKTSSCAVRIRLKLSVELERRQNAWMWHKKTFLSNKR